MIKTLAVNVGINLYDYNPEQNNLRGCANDARNLAQRFPCDHTLILDTQATKQNILTAWRQQRDKCRPGDTLRITHSSHGMEEGICCHNLGVKNGVWSSDGYIAYAEIADFCQEIPETILVEFLIDACHAKAGIRGLGMTYGKAKFMQMLEVDMRPKSPVELAKPSPMRANIILWAACEPNQTSADAYIDGEPQGAFTAAFLKFEKLGRIRSDIIFQARPWLKAQGYEQIPHLYCTHDKAMEVMA